MKRRRLHALKTQRLFILVDVDATETTSPQRGLQMGKNPF